eukprot:7349552-Pyramimonas_sp.AAC.1
MQLRQEHVRLREVGPHPGGVLSGVKSGVYVAHLEMDASLEQVELGLLLGIAIAADGVAEVA